MPGPLLSTSSKLIKDIYLPRSHDSKKGHYGKLLVVGGSSKYPGSPALVALAAYASGCDLVMVAAPESVANTIASFSPDIMICPLKGDVVGKKHVNKIIELAKWADAVVIGNGLGVENDTANAVVELVSKLDKPIVIDADGIKALPPKKHHALSGKNVVVTPHTHEMFIFAGKKVDADVESRVDLAKKLSLPLKITIILKGNVDVIANGNNTAINKTGSPYMTVGGTGDTLAGICGSLLARGVDLFSASSAAAFINGYAGELCARDFKEGLTASKIIDYIPKAIAKCA